MGLGEGEGEGVAVGGWGWGSTRMGLMRMMMMMKKKICKFWGGGLGDLGIKGIWALSCMDLVAFGVYLMVSGFSIYFYANYVLN
jgi:hypothetical protein